MHDDCRIVSAPSRAGANAVYAYAQRMENLPRWAAGLVTHIAQEDGRWFTDTPGGRIHIAMAPLNPFGVLDHDVTTPDGFTTHNAMRVTPVGTGSLLSFVVLRMPEATDAEFDRDCARVTQDLETLGALVERQSRA